MLVHALGGLLAGLPPAPNRRLPPAPNRRVNHEIACVLQPLKRIFEGCNYKSGPLSVGQFWSKKFVMNLRDSRRASWYSDGVESTEDFTTEVRQLAETSPLVAKLLLSQFRPYAVRSIKSFSRARVKIERMDYVLLRKGPSSAIARVRDLVECLVEDSQRGVSCVVRMWCDSCVQPNLGRNGELWAKPPRDAGDRCMLVEVEHMDIAPKVRNSHILHDVYT